MTYSTVLNFNFAVVRLPLVLRHMLISFELSIRSDAHYNNMFRNVDDCNNYAIFDESVTLRSSLDFYFSFEIFSLWIIIIITGAQSTNVRVRRNILRKSQTIFCHANNYSLKEYVINITILTRGYVKISWIFFTSDAPSLHIYYHENIFLDANIRF